MIVKLNSNTYRKENFFNLLKSSGEGFTSVLQDFMNATMTAIVIKEKRINSIIVPIIPNFDITILKTYLTVRICVQTSKSSKIQANIENIFLQEKRCV